MFPKNPEDTQVLACPRGVGCAALKELEFQGVIDQDFARKFMREKENHVCSSSDSREYPEERHGKLKKIQRFNNFRIFPVFLHRAEDASDCVRSRNGRAKHTIFMFFSAVRTRKIKEEWGRNMTNESAGKQKQFCVFLYIFGVAPF